MKNNLTASERRGLIAVAAIALILTGSGWIVSTCGHSGSVEEVPAEVEVLIHADSILGEDTPRDSVRTRKKRRHKTKNDSLRKKKLKSPRVYRKRSPIDEEIPMRRADK